MALLQQKGLGPSGEFSYSLKTLNKLKRRTLTTKCLDRQGNTNRYVTRKVVERDWSVFGNECIARTYDVGKGLPTCDEDKSDVSHISNKTSFQYVKVNCTVNKCIIGKT